MDFAVEGMEANRIIGSAHRLWQQSVCGKNLIKIVKLGPAGQLQPNRDIDHFPVLGHYPLVLKVVLIQQVSSQANSHGLDHMRGSYQLIKNVTVWNFDFSRLIVGLDQTACFLVKFVYISMYKPILGVGLQKINLLLQLQPVSPKIIAFQKGNIFPGSIFQAVDFVYYCAAIVGGIKRDGYFSDA